MNNNENYNIAELIFETTTLMKKYEIPIRDTWDSYFGKNYDDFFINGNKYDGLKHIKICSKLNGYSETQAERHYNIPNFNDFAYNEFKILIPNRLNSFKHPVIHELVHFLQVNNDELDRRYIQFNGSNIFEYLNQRLEKEAFFIQLIYISKYEIEFLNNHNSEEILLIKNFHLSKFSYDYDYTKEFNLIIQN